MSNTEPDTLQFGEVMAMPYKTRDFRLEATVPLPRTRVWDLLANNDHLNRVIGLFRIEAHSPARTDDGELFRLLQATKFGLVPIRWREYPFDWVQHREYRVVREYDQGPLARFVGGVALADAQTGTGGPGGVGGVGGSGRADACRVTLTAAFTPRNLLGVAAIYTDGLPAMRRTIAYLQRSAAEWAGGGVTPPPTMAARTPANEAALAEAFAGLAEAPVDREVAALLRRHLLNAPDDEVAAMRPFALARDWGTDRVETLRLFLYATLGGALRLRWSLLCPICRVSKEDAPTLGAVHAHAHCDFCDAQFQVNFDRYVELRFDVHPAIRRVSHSVYCVGSPGLTPHIIRQTYIKRGEEAELAYPDPGADLRLRVLRSPHMVQVDRRLPAAVAQPLHFTEDGWTAGAVPAGVAPRVVNRSDREIVVVVERTEWDPDAVTAARVTAMQEFRRLFSSEVLAPGQEVGIESVTLLFSDLRGSTALYEQVGDASAYGKVRRHFDYLIGHLTAANGALVKTIGDAVMAVFHSPEEGVRAALEMQLRIGELNAALPAGSEPLVLKLGLHHGPAIAINANDRLDYFGRTVNIAARVQRESRGADLVLSAETFARAGVQALATRYPVVWESYQAQLRGLDEPVPVVRIFPAPTDPNVVK